MRMNWKEDCERDIAKVISENKLSEVILMAVESIVDGACDRVMVNLGHSVCCDPDMTSYYGKRLLVAALDKLENGNG